MKPIFLTLVISLLGVPAAIAGELNPPPGPVGATMKTLMQVEPRVAISAATTPGDNDATPSLFKITQPGSYYLTANINGAVGMNGVEIACNDVTLDLSGMAMIGLPGSQSGIITSINAENVAVSNGVIRGWGNYAVYDSGKGARIADLRVSNNGNGIRAGANATVRDCVAQNNTATGITLASSCGLVRDCTSHDNGGSGFSLATASVIQNCTATENAQHGIIGIGGVTISHCTVVQNSAFGIVVENQSIVQNCTANANFSDGIRVTAHCRVADNQCSQNGIGVANGAGVHALGSFNRIDGNNVSYNDQGVSVDVAGNFIVRNSAADNFSGNFVIVGTQTIGPIISAVGTIATTNPWANFEF